jgi:hypothetical protein
MPKLVVPKLGERRVAVYDNLWRRKGVASSHGCMARVNILVMFQIITWF